MNIKQLFHSLTAVLLLTACSSDLAPEQSPAIAMPDGGEDLVPVEFSVSSGLSLTRAASSIVSFTSGEAVKVCVKPAGASDYTGYDFTTAAAGQTGVGLNAPASGDKPYFPVGASTTVQAYAYYPSTAGDAATFSVSADQTSDAGYKASNLMHAAVRTITKGSSTGTDLQMAHLMAQLHLNVTEVGLTVSSVIVNAKRSATFTPSAGTAVVTGSASDITAASAAGDAYICIPAQQISGVTVKVVASGSGDEASRTATYSFTSTDNFAAGSTYTINLTVNARQLGATTSIADWNGTSEVTVAPSGDMTIDDIAAVTYNGSAQTPTVVVKKNGATVSSSDYDLNWINNTNAGTAVVVATGKNTHAGSVAVATFTINKADVTLSTAPTKKTGLTYNGSGQALVNAGTVTGGTLKYKLDDGDYGTSVPTAVNANPTTGYSVTYYVEGDANHNSTDPVTISGITIAKKSITSSDITLATQTLTYNGSSQTRNIASVAGLTDASNWSVTGNTGTNASESYSMTVTMTDNCQNYTGNATKGWSIGKAATTVATAPTAASPWTADGSAHNLLASAGAASTGGTMYYYSSTTNSTPDTSASGWSTTIPQATTAGTYYVWYYSKGDSNHSDSSVGGPLTITVSSPYTAMSSATSSHVGQVICTNGHIHATVSVINCGGTASAVIAYVGSAGSVDASSSSYKGLAIALTDCSSTYQWYTANSGTCVSQNSNISTAITYKNGITSTNTLTSDGHTHAAASAAKNYSTARPSGASIWFLPSMGQWNLICQGLATKKAGSSVTTNLTTSSNSTYQASNLNSVITDAGGTGFQSDYYWSSTEYHANYAWVVYFGNGLALSLNKSNGLYVRAVFAF